MEWLKLPLYADLIEEAKKCKITYASKDRWELFSDLAGVSKNAIFKDIEVYDRIYSPGEILERKEKGMEILKKTIFPRSMRKEILEVLGKTPDAFANYVFGREDQEIQYIFNSDSVRCYCGKEFQMKREFKDLNNIDRTEPVDIKLCPNPTCMEDGLRRKWIKILIDIQEPTPSTMVS